MHCAGNLAAGKTSSDAQYKTFCFHIPFRLKEVERIFFASLNSKFYGDTRKHRTGTLIAPYKEYLQSLFEKSTLLVHLT